MPMCHCQLNRFKPMVGLWALALCYSLIAIIQGGCAKRSNVQAKPRESHTQPQFLDASTDRAPDAEARTSIVNDIDFSFLRPRHFGVASLRPGELSTNPILQVVNWTDLESSMAPWTGRENSHIQQINRIWIVFDSEQLAMLFGTSNGGSPAPLLIVIDYNRPIDQTSLATAADRRRAAGEAGGSPDHLATETGPDDANVGRERSANPSDSSNADQWTVQCVGEQRLLIGPVASIQPLLENGPPLSKDQLGVLATVDWNADFSAAFWMAPIRSTLQGLANMVAQFSQESTPWVDLPQAIQHVIVQVDLESKEDFATADVGLNDESMARDLAKFISNALEAPSNANGFSNPAAPDALQNLMFQPQTLAALQTVSQEIQTEGLVAIRNRSQLVHLTMARPDSLVPLVQAIVSDTHRQGNLAERTEHLNKIGQALRAFREQHGHLPRPGASGAAATGIDGFSWRVAILPQLGYQELYDQFDFAQPWDSPHNRKLAEQIPIEYQFDGGTQTLWTVFTGPDGAFELPDGELEYPSLDRIVDRKIWTALVLEASPERGMEWTAPGGISDADRLTDKFGIPGENGVLMLNASFQVRAVKKNPQAILAVLTRSGGEKLTRQDFIRIE